MARAWVLECNWTATSSLESADIYKPDSQASGFGASYSLARASGLYGRKPGAVQVSFSRYLHPAVA